MLERNLADFDSARRNLYDATLEAAQSIKPFAQNNREIRLADVGYDDKDDEDKFPDRYDYAAQADALTARSTLGRRLRGTWQMYDTESGKMLEQRRALLAVVPRVNEDGTMIYRGSRYAMLNQQRVKPSLFARVKKNEEVETHCFHRSVSVWTEFGMIPIGDIVRKRMNVRVWSYDFQTEKFVLRRVVGHYRNRVKGLGRAVFDAPGRLPSSFERYHPNVIWSTPDHKVFDQVGNKTEISLAKSLMAVEEQPSYTQTQLLLGSLLGDGYVSERGIYEEAHSLAQQAYLAFKGEILKPFMRSPVHVRTTNRKEHVCRGRRVAAQKKSYAWLNTKACAFLRRMYALCYVDGVKRVTRTWLDQLDEIGLAFWFCDDGSSRRAQNTDGPMNTAVVNLATNGFTRAEVDIVVAWLFDRWGLVASVNCNHKERAGRDNNWVVQLTAEEAEQFLDIVSPYMHESMLYKLPHRPITKKCVGCGKEIARRNKRCNTCAIALPWQTRNPARFGGSAVVGDIRSSGIIPQDASPGKAWDTRMLMASSRVPALLQDLSPVLSLVAVPYEFRQNEGLHFEKCSAAYDIEVEGTHNYFANGMLVSNCNVSQGTGTSHRYILNPETGQFSINVGHSRVPLAPFLRLLGTTDDEMRAAWGDEIAEKNFAKNDRGALQKLYEKLVSRRDQVPGADPQTQQLLIQQAISRSEIDPWSTERTTGIKSDRLSPAVVLAATKKVLALNRQEADGDDRDHLAYQTFHTVEDLLPERIKLDRGSLVRKTLRESIRRGSLSSISPRLLQQHIQSGIFESSLGVQPEFANPLDGMDRATRLTKMGEGGLSSLDAVPLESRDVHMSQMGFVDGARTVESLKTGIDTNLVSGARRGVDGRLRTPVINRKTGQLEYKSPEDLVDATVAFSDKDHEVPGYLVVSKGGQFDYAKPEEVDYVLPNPEDSMMSHMSNLVPGKNASVQNRLAMGTRMIAQALPLREPEAPWVQSAVPGSNGQQSYEDLYSNRVGAIKSLYSGTVKEIQPGAIIVTTPEGDKRVSIHKSTPLGSKTRLANKPIVKPGDQVTPGQLLATSNFTNSKGTMSLGRNARVALMPWGDNYEDAFTISRSFADRLASDHAYRYRLTPEEGWRLDKKHYIGSIPSEFKKEQLEKLDDKGVIQVGQLVRPGDPLILAAAPKRGSTSQRITRKRGPSFQDQSLTWDQDVDGIVEDVRVLPSGDRVVQVTAAHPTEDGDKIADRYGAKGVVTIVPDEQMIRDKDGNPFDVVASDLGLISRSNAGRAADILLGKVAAKRGKPIILEDFDTKRDLMDFARQELEKEGIPDMEEVFDPRNGRKVPKVLTGNTFIMKLHHMSASKSQARGVGRYTQEGTPAKGGDEGSMAKRLSNQEMNALMAHQAYEFVREGSLVRGQRNEEYWSRYMNGHETPTPAIPEVYRKFHSYLRGIGVNPVKEGTKTKLMLLSDKDTVSLAGAREVRSGETVDANKDLKPIAGGLFDTKTFGDGTLWGRYQLSEAMPHPLMEDPIRKLMGVTKNQYRSILAGDEDFGKFGNGPDAIRGFLSSIDVNREVELARAKAKDSRKTHREAGVVRLRYLRGLQDRGIDPKDMMIQQIPILPPTFRPVSKLSGKDAPLIDGMNLLYRDMIDADKALKGIKGFSSKPSSERLAVYDAIQAAMGLREPVDPELRQKKVTGLMGRLMGQHGPKTGFVQRKLLSGTVDLVGRGVIAPSTDLQLDEVGIPEGQAWETFKMPVLREMRRQGRPLGVAMKEWEQRSPTAKTTLERLMDQKLVAMSRAPVLHKFGMLAYRPKLIRGNTIRMNPLVYQGYAADNDGDQVNFHVILGDKAVEEAKRKWLPSRTLLSPRDFKTPMFVPNQDHALGLYRASVDRNDKVHEKVYATLDDAKKAFARGEINIDTPVRIMSKK